MDVNEVSGPCMFNMPFYDVKLNRYEELSFKLQEDVKQNPNSEEKIWLLDLLTWVHYKLNHFKKSLKFNNKVMGETHTHSLVSIANRIFVLKRLGRELDTPKYLQELENILTDEEAVSEAKAQQAYCCLRLGGTKNLQKAVELFKSSAGKLKSSKKLILCQFYFGLSYRRLVHPYTLSCLKTPVNLQEFVTEAERLFLEVINNSCDTSFKSRAYSELLVLCNDADCILGEEECRSLLKNLCVEELCDKALELELNNPRVLTSCGRILCSRNESSLRKGVELLEQSVKLKEDTTAYHNLGLGYMKLSVMELNQNGSNDKVKVQRIEAEHPRVKEAMQYLKKAIEISKEYNLPAMFDLGKLLKSMGEFEKAVIQFNKVIESDTRKDICFFLVIDSLEQSGLCLLELYEIEIDAEKKAYYKKQAENKLTQAVGLQSQLVSTISLTAKIWNSLRTLKSKYECEERSTVMIKKLVNLLGVALEHKEVLSFIKKLSSDEMTDPDVAKQALESFLVEGEYTSAFGFLNMLSTLPSPVTIDADLSLRVQLKMAASQLISKEFNPRYIFKAMFDQHYAHVRGQSVDILILYDESHDTEQEVSRAAAMANQLLYIFSDIFSLEVDINLKKSSLYGCAIPVQLEEMQRCRLLVVLLGLEQRDSDFDTLLEYIPHLSKDLTVLVMTVYGAIKVPDLLAIHKHMCLKDLLLYFKNSCTDVSECEKYIRGVSQYSKSETKCHTLERLDQDNNIVEINKLKGRLWLSGQEVEIYANVVMELFSFLLGRAWN